MAANGNKGGQLQRGQGWQSSGVFEKSEGGQAPAMATVTKRAIANGNRVAGKAQWQGWQEQWRLLQRWHWHQRGNGKDGNSNGYGNNEGDGMEEGNKG
jgi:hypothetical protein